MAVALKQHDVDSQLHPHDGVTDALADINGCVDCDALMLPSVLVAAGLGDGETLDDAMLVEAPPVDAATDTEAETDAPAGRVDALADSDPPVDAMAD